MSAPLATPDTPPTTPPVAVYNVVRPATKEETDHIVVYGHSSLLYWWPVWLACFVLAAMTYAEGDRSGGVTVSTSNGPGAAFVIILLAVTFSSTVILRGMVSVVAVISLVAVTVAFAWFGWWGDILAFIGGLEIRINAAGYVCFGLPLFVGWLAVILLYDQQHYVAFGRGQIRYVVEVGDSEVAVPSEGSVVEKRRSDAFRHWVLGLGTGDLVIRAGGRNGLAIELKNVLHIRRKLALINKLLREKTVTVN